MSMGLSHGECSGEPSLGRAFQLQMEMSQEISRDTLTHFNLWAFLPEEYLQWLKCSEVPFLSLENAEGQEFSPDLTSHFFFPRLKHCLVHSGPT